jgi:GDPmannose 4,6-dehydratase
LGTPVALITGITGQDGSKLADLLLSKNYEVHGVVRRSSSFNTWRIEHIRSRLKLHYGDMCDGSSLYRILKEVGPDEVYNLAAQSHVGVSFEVPEYTAESDALGTLRLLEAIKSLKLGCRFYQASTSELYGSSPPKQNEETPFRPRSPYAAAKLYAHWLTVQYREAFGLHASCGVLFNHESPSRGENFVTRKVCRTVARGEKLLLGNLEAIRDWGHAREYVYGMWLMVQQPTPSDYVLATGEGHTVRELVEEAYRYVGKPVQVDLDPSQIRPLEVNALIGDSTKARRVLGWEPKVTFKQLIAEMMEAEIDSARKAGSVGQRIAVPDGVHYLGIPDSRGEVRT